MPRSEAALAKRPVIAPDENPTTNLSGTLTNGGASTVVPEVPTPQAVTTPQDTMGMVNLFGNKKETALGRILTDESVAPGVGTQYIPRTTTNKLPPAPSIKDGIRGYGDDMAGDAEKYWDEFRSSWSPVPLAIMGAKMTGRTLALPSKLAAAMGTDFGKRAAAGASAGYDVIREDKARQRLKRVQSGKEPESYLNDRDREILGLPKKEKKNVYIQMQNSSAKDEANNALGAGIGAGVVLGGVAGGAFIENKKKLEKMKINRKNKNVERAVQRENRKIEEALRQKKVDTDMKRAAAARKRAATMKKNSKLKEAIKPETPNGQVGTTSKTTAPLSQAIKTQHPKTSNAKIMETIKKTSAMGDKMPHQYEGHLRSINNEVLLDTYDALKAKMPSLYKESMSLLTDTEKAEVKELMSTSNWESVSAFLEGILRDNGSLTTKAPISRYRKMREMLGDFSREIASRSQKRRNRKIEKPLIEKALDVGYKVLKNKAVKKVIQGVE